MLSSGALNEAYIKDLKLFRFSTHPKIAPKIEEMKTEITKYNSLVKSIKPLRQRLGRMAKRHLLAALLPARQRG